MTAITHNLAAQNIWGNLQKSTAIKEKSSLKLSSGYQINSAADDAAGLTISEEMRTMIRGLSKAETNTQDGISTIQTAEGGMIEIGDMLKRQRELTIQALNDTNTTEDRESIQAELDQLTSEIDGIANKTEFNGIKVLLANGKYIEGGGHDLMLPPKPTGTMPKIPASAIVMNSGTITSNITQDMVIDGNVTLGNNITIADNVNLYITKGSTINLNGKNLYAGGTVHNDGNILMDPVKGGLIAPNDELTSSKDIQGTIYNYSNGYIDNIGAKSTMPMDELDPKRNGRVINYGQIFAVLNANELINAGEIELMGNAYHTENHGHIGEIRYNYNQHQSDGLEINNYGTVDTLTSNGELLPGAKTTEDKFNNYGTLTNVGQNNGIIECWSTPPTIAVNNGKLILHCDDPNMRMVTVPPALWIQSGAKQHQGIMIDLYDCRANTLGISEINVLNRNDANQALDNIDKAAATVSAYRSTAGAQQNRLEHTANNIGVAVENTTSAESRIRDCDMAKEMINNKMADILLQSGFSLLAQANSSQESLLRLLQ
jgi:flagellin